MDLPPVLIYLASFLTVSAGVYALFSRADDLVTVKTKQDFALALRTAATGEAAQQWPQFFHRMFDTIFGERHLTLKCFLRSCVASLATVAVLFMLWLATEDEDYEQFAHWLREDGITFVLFVLLTPAIINLIPDYLSLLKSRRILKHLSTGPRTLTLLACDIVASAAISVTALVIGVVLLSSLEDMKWQPELFLESFRAVSEAMSFHLDNFDIPMGVFFYSTLFTSIWALLFVISGMAIRLGVRATSLISKNFNIDEKPFSSLGFASVVLLAALYILAAPFILL